tara:strand:+ start:2629 stop:3333 length:705 start_codon:yes stop_codon:yes gene_type:complete
MAATDLNDLNNFEYHFETAAATFLNTDTGIDVFRTVIEDNLTAPRLEIQLFVDGAMEPFAPRNGGASSTSQDYRAFTGVFQCRVITDNATGGAANHATYRSKVRTSLMRTAENWYGGGAGGALTGTGSISSGTTDLTGTGTVFTTELEVGNHFTVETEAFVIASISSDTELNVVTASAANYTNGSLGLSASNLPYYNVKKLMPAGTDYEVDGDMNVTQLMYELTFEIRDDAWPA